MPPKSNIPFRLPDRFAPLFLFIGFLFLLFGIYLFIRGASARHNLQSLQTQNHLLLDQKRILEGQVLQLQEEHRKKEAFVRRAENELSMGEQKELVASLQTVESQEKFAQNKARAAELELTLRKTASAREVEVLFEGEVLVLRFSESTLFGPGELSVTSSGRKLLATVAQSLNQQFAGRPIRVEGHSDNSQVPGGLKQRFPSNWELTSFRAASVARTLQEGSQVDPARLTPLGKSGTAPVESNETREGRTKNRRIDLVISLQDSKGLAIPTPSIP